MVVLASLASKWGIIGLAPVPCMTHSSVFFGTRERDGLPIALKLAVDRETTRREMVALQSYQGKGSVHLLAYDLDKNALLLERIIPGKSLKTFFPTEDEKAVTVAVDVMKQIHQAPVDDTLPTLENWLRTLRNTHNIPERSLEKACRLVFDLSKSATKKVLLHGDLHHDNILWSDQRGWVAIDPKGVVGDVAYEVATFIRNPIFELMQQPNIEYILDKRFELFADLLAIDERRLRLWAYVHAVASACWSLEDGTDPFYALRVAELLDK